MKGTISASAKLCPLKKPHQRIKSSQLRRWGNHTSNSTTKPSNQTVANSTSTFYAVNGSTIAGIVIDAVVLVSLLEALAFYAYRHLPSRSAKLSTASRPASPAGDMEHNPDPDTGTQVKEPPERLRDFLGLSSVDLRPRLRWVSMIQSTKYKVLL